jgi:hypothetical protein
MNATDKPKTAMVVPVAVHIWCQQCDRDDPIPASDGSFMWESVPYSVKCPSCGRVSRTPKTVKV